MGWRELSKAGVAVRCDPASRRRELDQAGIGKAADRNRRLN